MSRQSRLPPPTPPDRSETLESLPGYRSEALRAAPGKGLDFDGSPPLGEAARSEVVELLVGMLFADRTAFLAAANTPSPEGLRFLTDEEIEEIVRRIEEVSLDGIEVDRLVERLAATLDSSRTWTPDTAIPPPRAPGKKPGGDPSSS